MPSRFATSMRLQCESMARTTQVRCDGKLLRVQFTFQHFPLLADLWLGYIRSELSFGVAGAANVTQLHWRAKRELDKQLVENFAAQYSLLLQSTSEQTTRERMSSGHF